MVLGLLLALLACGLYGVATLLQAVGSRRAEGMGALVQPLVVAGLVLDGVAFLVSLVAYARAPLFLVQTIIAAAVVVSVLGAPRVLPGVRLRRADVVGAGVVLVGLAVLACAAGPEDPRRPAASFVTTLVVLAAVLAVATALCYRRAPAWVVAALAGLGFSLVAIGTRAAETDGTLQGALTHPAALVVVLGGAVGVVGNIRALERGSVAVAAATVSVVEVVVPSVVGLAVLGDDVRAGWAVPLVLAVVVALGGCAMLAASPAGRATA
ncbi:MAG: hypothetical protein J0H73_03100 [Salana multivorans]|uniref:hypothetical protein n=1 Tax=Salana multivorans TaxID=120377 RepID=UPI0009668BF2|nr:hypothetical protein [Salana multivorans]MBN8881285.1 hypothetical protein [Salana multivorans]OJX97432.1 MAG: hypothetical protein BGO96_05860 [Micrococcales bacterium 73-15]